MSAAERILRAVHLDEVTGCWVWTRYLDASGYGRLRVDGRKTLAHRAAFELLRGPIPEGLQIDHLCRRRACVNPDHLEPVSLQENVARGLSGAAQAARTECPQGHPYTPENTIQHSSGFRRCRICHNAQGRARRARATSQDLTPTRKATQ